MNITAPTGQTVQRRDPFRAMKAFEASPEFERLDVVEKAVYTSGKLLAGAGRREELAGLGFGLAVAGSLALAAGRFHWVLLGPGTLGFVVGSLLSRDALRAESALDRELGAVSKDPGATSRVPLAAGALGVLVVAPAVMTGALAGLAALPLPTGLASGLGMAAVAGSVGVAVVCAGKVGSVSQRVDQARSDFHSRLAATASVADLMDGSLGEILLAPDEVVIEGHPLPVRSYTGGS